MSSAQSTITSNVNLLLVNSSVITLNNPYIAYVSSITVPGRIATVRDATGLVSSPGRLIILSTLKDVLFSDGTSSITISQPFGYVSLSSRDKNTWDVINTFAFPQPSPVSYVSSVYATASINANNLISRSYVSTATINTSTLNLLQVNSNNYVEYTVNNSGYLSYSLSRTVAGDWANFRAEKNLDISNNIISNVSQATILNTVQTNIVMARSLLITTSNSDTVNAASAFDIFSSCNVSPFTFTKTGFSNYSFTFQLNGSTQSANPTNDLIYYFYLSNSVQNTISYGRNFNPSYAYLQKQNSYFPTRTAFTYSDIFNLNSWNTGDTIYVYLNANNSNSYPIAFTNVNLSLVYQPLFS
jgi:hypothetical protein